MLFARLVIAMHVAGVIALIALAASNTRTSCESLGCQGLGVL